MFSEAENGKYKAAGYAFTAISVIFIAALSVLTVKAFPDIVEIMVFSVIFAYLLFPLKSFLEKNFGNTVAALLSVLALALVIAGLLFTVIPVLTEQILSLGEKISELYEKAKGITDGINGFLSGINVRISFDELIGEKMLTENFFDLKGVLDSVIGFAKAIPTAALVPVFTFYFLKDYDYFKKNISFLFPMRTRKKLGLLISSADKTLKSYIKTESAVALIVGIGTFAGYLIIGVPYSLVLGLFMGVCEIIPYFGPVIGAVPACLVVLMEKPEMFIASLIVVIAVQQLEGNFISPYLMGSSFNINPVTVILVLLISGRIFGFVGLILAIPFYTVVRNVISDVYNKTVKAG